MTIARLLVAVDFSPASIAAARWAITALAPRADVVLAHAVDVPEPPGFLRSLFAPNEQIEAAAFPAAQRRLEELRGMVGAPNATLDVRRGKAYAALHAACTEHRADILVIGPHGDRSGLGRLLGSTAERAVRDAEVPVVVTAGGEGGRPRTIAVAVDDSPAGRRALRFAAALAREQECALVAVTVVNAELGGAVSMSSAPREREQGLAELRAAAEHWLRAQTADLALPAGPLTLVVRTGHPADEVVTAAREAHADILVIGRNASGRPTTGSSIADLVIRAATNATIVVPA